LGLIKIQRCNAKVTNFLPTLRLRSYIREYQSCSKSKMHLEWKNRERLILNGATSLVVVIWVCQRYVYRKTLKFRPLVVRRLRFNGIVDATTAAIATSTAAQNPSPSRRLSVLLYISFFFRPRGRASPRTPVAKPPGRASLDPFQVPNDLFPVGVFGY